MLTDEDNEYLGVTYHGMQSVKRGFMNVNGSTEVTTVIFPNDTTIDEFVETYNLDLYTANIFNPDYSQSRWAKSLLIENFNGVSFTEKYRDGKTSIEIHDDLNDVLFTHHLDEVSLAKKYCLAMLMVLYYDFEKDAERKEKLLELIGRANEGWN